jgi:hypothetical protein
LKRKTKKRNRNLTGTTYLLTFEGICFESQEKEQNIKMLNFFFIIAYFNDISASIWSKTIKQSIGKVCQARLDKNEIHYSLVRRGVDVL